MSLPDLTIENLLWKKGINYIVGIDEVGRGSWAGPLVAAGVILPKNFVIPKTLDDSKRVKPKERIKLAKIIETYAISIKIVEIDNISINKLGIAQSTQIIFKKIVNTISPKPDFSLIDAYKVKSIAQNKQMSIIHGDEKSASIAAASIIAKIYRDNLMQQFSKLYPNYNFEKNKGYGTLHHMQTIKKMGFSQIHRTSYNLKFLSQ